MSAQDSLDHILGLLHECALDDARWPAAAHLINQAAKANGNVLVLGKGRWQTEAELYYVRFAFRGQWGEDMQQEYFRRYWMRDESVPRIAALPAGQLAHTGELYTGRERKTSAAYNVARREAGDAERSQRASERPWRGHTSCGSSPTPSHAEAGARPRSRRSRGCYRT